MGLVEVEN